MSDQAEPEATKTVMGSFLEIEPVADALDALRAEGISEEQITIMSSLPYSSNILGRPHVRTRLPLISLVSAVLGLLVGVFFTVITPNLYIIRVGGQPIVPFPPTALLLYEFIMLFLIVGTFGGFLVLNHFPSSEPQPYDRKLNDGRISILVDCPAGQAAAATAALQAHGAQNAHEPERREL